MDTRDAAAEAAKLVLQIGSAAADALLFVADLGEELPFINPVLKTLRAVREKLETVKGNRRDLEALHERCTYITACVIEKCRRSPSEFDVTPLVKCVEAVESMVERCGRRGRLLRVLKAYTVRNEMAELNARMDRLTGDLGLAGIAILVSWFDWSLALSVYSAKMSLRYQQHPIVQIVMHLTKNHDHLTRTSRSQLNQLPSCLPNSAWP